MMLKVLMQEKHKRYNVL